ncbi:sensor histidine kinase [Rubripirellula tenax]|uniref:sensor histidine kinase n=1 Tax=Rubripirellula tenax TaxID=2528015 RepID=UPI001FEB624E|nr:histidine kinase [Rubripirellula tenax]
MIITFGAFIGAISSCLPADVTATPVINDSDLDEWQLKRLSVSQLEQRIATIDRQLRSLAKPSFRTGVAAVGYRSQEQSIQATTDWIQVTLNKPAIIDQVVLVPTIWRDSLLGFQADAFPLEFCVRIGDGADEDGEIVGRYGAKDRLLPRVAPVVVSFPARKASWARIEVNTLSPRGWDGAFLLQLSEILIFSGHVNVALRQAVETSSNFGFDHSPWDSEYLVDGFVPYLMDASQGRPSLAFVSEISRDRMVSLTIDLGKPEWISEVRLHATDVSDTAPQSQPENFGIPSQLVIKGANLPDFSDGVRLVEHTSGSPYDSGPILTTRFSKTCCRYVQLEIVNPFVVPEGMVRRTGAWLGFAEIEILASGQNVALNKNVKANTVFIRAQKGRLLSSLTDGRNMLGKILPTRQWLSELATRHDLEKERPRVAAELSSRYRQQKANLIRMSWLAGLLILIVICTILVERITRRRAVLQTRERIAADLHDELGANLHAIALLGDLAQAATDSPDRVKNMLQRSRALTERSGEALRYCSNMLVSDGLFGDLEENMRRCADHVTADLDHELTLESAGVDMEVKPRVRVDLFLFYKECLTNILRHAHATKVTTVLRFDGNHLYLTVTDNGCGLNQSRSNRVPKSLRRRARLLSARVSATDVVDGGTKVELKLRTRYFGLQSRKSINVAEYPHHDDRR